MLFELSPEAAATVAGLIAEINEIQKVTGNEDGLGTDAVTAPDEVWDQLRANFPLSLFKEHGEWVGKEEEDE